MTIDSSWLSAFKEELPHAFTRKQPFAPYAVFVDGQIRLMQGVQSEPQTWDDFINRQFTRHLLRFYETTDVVVLAFDNYEKVPHAKCMTQVKRRKHIPPIPFASHSELPCLVPEGDRWAQCIANRIFKTRVIDLVLLRLPDALLRGHATRRLVVDYQQPVEWRFDAATGLLRRETLADLPPLGEADVKFTRHAERYERLLVDSIDGDSIPIALMHHELQLRSCRPPSLVCIYRLELHSRPPPEKPPSDGKEKRPAEAAQKARRTYEYVNVHALYAGLKDAIAQCTGRVRVASHSGHEMAMLIALISLTGTDFSRHLPQLSGKTLFAYLPDLWGAVVAAFDPRERCLRDEAGEGLVALMYRLKFRKHASSERLEDLLRELQASPLSARIRDSLPSRARIACTLRNANWILAYWTCGPAPDPLQPAFGFRRLPNGSPAYDDGPGE